MATAEFAKAPIGSLTIGVISGNTLVWTNSYGSADMEANTHADRDTVYRIGSITKMFTATMLEQLIEAGKVTLEDPVEKYFPEVNTIQGRKPDDAPITLRQLATHTSGLAREPDNIARYTTGPPEVWDKTLILALPHLHYQFSPGTRYSYSNIGYATLGAALQKAAGQPYLDYLPQHIFTPLGMTHTSLVLTPEVQAHLAKGYEKTGGITSSSAATEENKDGRGYKVPNGAIYTTVGDLAKFASFLLGNGPSSVLDPNKLLYYQNQFIVPTGGLAPAGYSLGIMFIRYQKFVAEGHSGAVSGFNAALYINRKANIAVVVLVSALGDGAVNADALALRALDVLSK